MLKGKELGSAIREAINLKLAKGGASSRAEIARYFGVKPPSVSDWINKGSISKDKLPKLWKYFSDVVGYSHWGLEQSEWPHGLSSEDKKPQNNNESIPSDVLEIAKLIDTLDKEDKNILLTVARRLSDENKNDGWRTSLNMGEQPYESSTGSNKSSPQTENGGD